MSNPVLSAIADRRSIRAYQPQPLTDEQIDALLTAAVAAPSARNAQPWHFSVTRDTALLAEINAETIQQIGEDLGDIFYGASLVIFVSCEAAGRWARLDCGIAVQTLALAAHALGLGSVILGLPDNAFAGPRGEEFNRRLKFPPGHSFAVAIAIGVPAATKEAHPLEPDRIDFID
ncbi:MAG: nitroreductase family protein [Oscillospiraceae bacterium]|jgi:nitroreductase|nr:nitroreductase family protein [Oscillospiraceae bacterium]